MLFSTFVALVTLSKVFLVFLRLSSSTKEHRILPTLYPKPALTIYHNNVIHDGLTPAVVDYSDIDQQYTEFVSNLGLLKMHHVMDLVSILSENNRNMSTFLLDCIYNAKPMAFKKEVGSTVTEISRVSHSDVKLFIGIYFILQATIQLTEAVVALHQKLFDKPTINSASKAKKPTVTAASSAMKPHDQPGNKLHFLASFAVDIVYSYACWLDAARNTLGNTELFG